MKETVTGDTRLSEDEVLVTRLREAINRPGLDPTTVLEMLATWVEREFSGDDVTDELATTFQQQVEGDDGLGVPLERLMAIITDEKTFPHRYELPERLDVATAERMKQLRKRVKRLAWGTAGEYGGYRKAGQVHNMNLTHPEDPSGIVRRLNRDRPDLAERVASGEMSANAAAIEAGIRSRKISVNTSDPASTARTLRKHMSHDNLVELGRLINNDDTTDS